MSASVNLHGLFIPCFCCQQQKPGIYWPSQTEKCQDRFTGIFRRHRHTSEKSHQTLFCMLRCLKSLQIPSLLFSLAAHVVCQAAAYDPSTWEQSLPVCCVPCTHVPINSLTQGLRNAWHCNYGCGLLEWYNPKHYHLGYIQRKVLCTG